jgi:cell filamentation protein
MYDAVEDPYTYRNSTVLVNKLDLRTQDELDAFEAEISTARAEEPLPEGMLDFAALSGHPPSPVPGCLRMGRSASNRPDIERRQSLWFPREYPNQATKLFDELKKADHLKSLDPQKFADQAAHFLAELNAIHAFREGNGGANLPSSLCWPIKPDICLIWTTSILKQCWRR